MYSEDWSLIKARLLQTSFSSYEGFSIDWSPFENLTTFEFKTLRHLSKNKNIVIQKPGKGNNIVIDQTSYISNNEKILRDHTKFSDLDIPTGKEISYITNLEKRITSGLKLLKWRKLLIIPLIRILTSWV